MSQPINVKETIRNIVDQMIDADIPNGMTISEFVYSYFETSYLKIIDPMVEIVVDEYITVAQIEAIIYAFKNRSNDTTATEIHNTINTAYGREIV